MTKTEQIARLAVARSTKRGIVVVIASNNQRQTVELLRSIEPRAVLSLVGSDAIRVHGCCWGDAKPAAKAAA
jgi:hypothetical protein